MNYEFNSEDFFISQLDFSTFDSSSKNLNSFQKQRNSIQQQQLNFSSATATKFYPATNKFNSTKTKI